MVTREAGLSSTLMKRLEGVLLICSVWMFAELGNFSGRGKSCAFFEQP
jgi:hypothetical protein